MTNSEALQIDSKKLSHFFTASRYKSYGGLVLSLTAYSLGVLTALKFGAIGYLMGIFVAATALVRLFSIQHDCGHGSYFSSKFENLFWGRLISLFTLTPFTFWRLEHALHHKNHGKLEERGTSDIWTLTVSEYQNAGSRIKLAYRIYRSPICLLIVGPLFLFIIKRRLPTGLALRFQRARNSVLLLNSSLVLIATTAIYFGLGLFLLTIYVPVILLAGGFGIFIFTVQHNFENAYWESENVWQFRDASLEGSSVLNYGAVFDILTGNIAYHNVHHLFPLIPSYNLKKAYHEVKHQLPDRELSFKESVGALNLTLWDDERKILVNFPR